MRLIMFSAAAGAAMWILGFIFYGLLFNLGWATAPEATQLAVQSALRALPGTGTYVIPMGETKAMLDAYAAGPVAEISYNSRGYAPFDPVTFVAGFFQFAVVAAMIGWILSALGDRVDVIGRVRVVLGLAAVAAVVTRASQSSSSRLTSPRASGSSSTTSTRTPASSEQRSVDSARSSPPAFG